MGGDLSFAAADSKIAPRVMTFLQNRGLKNFTLSDKYNNEIKKGFIIKNGAVKINYSIKAIIENMSAELEPDIVKMLFSGY
jgi:vacuolar-type H+-ATPase subunit E/Vma4